VLGHQLRRRGRARSLRHRVVVVVVRISLLARVVTGTNQANGKAQSIAWPGRSKVASADSKVCRMVHMPADLGTVACLQRVLLMPHLQHRRQPQRIIPLLNRSSG
jgi:hypothetical protein